MGMYDEIFVKEQLPIPNELQHLNINWEEVVFQTKDLDNCLVEYIIEGGRLYEKIVERKYIKYTEEERKNKDIKPWNLWKDVIEVSSELKCIEDFHGTILFYAFESLSKEEAFWIEFKAYFVYGKLDKIVLSEFETRRKRNDVDEILQLSKQQQHSP